MSNNDDLKSCPMPGCGGKGHLITDGGSFDGFVRCEECGFQCEEDYWQSLPRPSESVREIAREMREMTWASTPDGRVDFEDASQTHISYGSLRDWATRLEALADAGTVGEVWVRHCHAVQPDGSYEMVYDVRTEDMSGMAENWHRVPIIGAPAPEEGECEPFPSDESTYWADRAEAAEAERDSLRDRVAELEAWFSKACAELEEQNPDRCEPWRDYITGHPAPPESPDEPLSPPEQSELSGDSGSSVTPSPLDRAKEKLSEAWDEKQGKSSAYDAYVMAHGNRAALSNILDHLTADRGKESTDARKAGEAAVEIFTKLKRHCDRITALEETTARISSEALVEEIGNLDDRINTLESRADRARDRRERFIEFGKREWRSNLFEMCWDGLLVLTGADTKGDDNE